MSNSHQHEVNFQWTGVIKGALSNQALSTQIEVAIPPDFDNGMAGRKEPNFLVFQLIFTPLLPWFFKK